MSDPFLIPEARIKRVGAARPYTIDFKAWLRSYWIAGRAYNTGDFVRPPSISGFAFQAGAAGEAGVTEPAWPRTLGGTAVDGSITWTAVAPGINAVDAIASVAWSQINPPDSSLVISAPVNTNEEATATFAGGTSGNVYRIQCAVTTASSKVYPVQFDLQIT
jgi:hypothetical protein